MMVTKKKKRFIMAFIILLAFFSLIILFFFDPLKVSFYPHCPFFMLTGYKCPGCGSLRALHALLHGKVLLAWRFNPALIIGLLLLVFIVTVHYLRDRKPWLTRIDCFLYDHRFIYFLFIMIVMWWLLRNLFAL